MVFGTVVLGLRLHIVVVVSVCAILCAGLLASPVHGAETLIWENDVHSSGVPVVSPVLHGGRGYRIVATLTWWYNYDENLAADAMYYTTDPSNSVFWGNHFICPGGHSFLQIDGLDEDWGPFNNGDTNHIYTILRAGEGAALSFQIVDWVDNSTANNISHIHLLIYSQTTVGGYISDDTQSSLSYIGVAALIFGGIVAATFVKKRFF